MVAPGDDPRFAICESEEDGGSRLTLTGELDLATAPALRDRLKRARGRTYASRFVCCSCSPAD
jgi:anti-anti-sigma regulatory factor